MNISLESKDIIIITLLIVNFFLVWRSFGSIPATLPKWFFEAAAERAEETPGTIDDKLVAILEDIYNRLNPEQVNVTAPAEEGATSVTKPII